MPCHRAAWEELRLDVTCPNSRYATSLSRIGKHSPLSLIGTARAEESWGGGKVVRGSFDNVAWSELPAFAADAAGYGD